MTKYVVVFEQEFAPQQGVSLVDAESVEAAKQQILEQIPAGMGISLTILNVFPVEPEAPQTPDTNKLVLV